MNALRALYAQSTANNAAGASLSAHEFWCSQVSRPSRQSQDPSTPFGSMALGGARAGADARAAAAIGAASQGGLAVDWRGAAPVTEEPLSADNYRRRTIAALNKLTADNITPIGDRILTAIQFGAKEQGVLAVRDMAVLMVGEASDADNFAELYSRLAMRIHQQGKGALAGVAPWDEANQDTAYDVACAALGGEAEAFRRAGPPPVGAAPTSDEAGLSSMAGSTVAAAMRFAAVQDGDGDGDGEGEASTYVGAAQWFDPRRSFRW